MHLLSFTMCTPFPFLSLRFFFFFLNRCCVLCKVCRAVAHNAYSKLEHGSVLQLRVSPHRLHHHEVLCGRLHPNVHTHRDKERQREAERDKERKRETKRDKERHSHTHTHTYTEHTHTHTMPLLCSSSPPNWAKSIVPRRTKQAGLGAS